MASPSLGSDPRIWVTQPKQWRRVITRSVGVAALSTQRSRSVSVFNTDVNVGAASAEGTISATVAPVVEDIYLLILLGIVLHMRRRDALGVWSACRDGRTGCRVLMRGADGAS